MFSPHDLTFVTWFSFSVNKKNYKAKFYTSLILKKIHKDNFLKKIHEEKHCSNPQCFVRKVTVFFPVKLTKIILKKNHNKRTT
jgi:hypothetical protein